MALCAVLAGATSGTASQAVATGGDLGIIRRGPKGCREIALTFDLCPVKHGSGFDQALVDELVHDRIPATFFASGRWMATHDRELRRLLAVPFFEIETHGERHAHLAGLGAAAQRVEIEGAVDRLRTRYGVTPKLFRPPYGEYDATTIAVAHELGLQVILWSAVSGDPDPRLAEPAIVERLSHRLRDGGVLVFHANGRGWHTAESVRDLEPKITAAALRAATVEEILGGCASPR